MSRLPRHWVGSGVPDAFRNYEFYILIAQFLLHLLCAQGNRQTTQCPGPGDTLLGVALMKLA